MASASVVSAGIPPSCFLYGDDLQLMLRALETKHYKTELDSDTRYRSSLIYVNISFENNEYDDISNYILVDTNLPLPSSASEREKISAYYEIELVMKEQTSLDKLNEILAWQRSTETDDNAEQLLQVMVDLKHHRDLIFHLTTTEYMKTKESEPEFVSKTLKVQGDLDSQVNKKWVDASINFELKILDKTANHELFKVEKVEIKFNRLTEYTYSIGEDELSKFFCPVLKRGDFYQINKLLDTKGKEKEKLEGVNSSLILDALTWFENGVMHACSDADWIHSVYMCLNVYVHRTTSRKAVIVMRLECLRICKIIKHHLSHKLNTEEMFFKSNREKPESLKSINLQEHIGKSIVSVFRSQQAKTDCYYHTCLILDSSFGSDTRCLINGLKKYVLGLNECLALPEPKVRKPEIISKKKKVVFAQVADNKKPVTTIEKPRKNQKLNFAGETNRNLLKLYLVCGSSLIFFTLIIILNLRCC